MEEYERVVDKESEKRYQEATNVKGEKEAMKGKLRKQSIN